jgi:predicted DNA-binding transcriptional regulator AlpA
MGRKRVMQSEGVQTTMDLFDYARRLPVAVADEEVWKVRTILAKTGLSRSSLYAYVKAGDFPRQRKLGPRRVGWLASDVRRWMATRPQTD